MHSKPRRWLAISMALALGTLANRLPAEGPVTAMLVNTVPFGAEFAGAEKLRFKKATIDDGLQKTLALTRAVSAALLPIYTKAAGFDANVVVLLTPNHGIRVWPKGVESPMWINPEDPSFEAVFLRCADPLRVPHVQIQFTTHPAPNETELLPSPTMPKFKVAKFDIDLTANASDKQLAHLVYRSLPLIVSDAVKLGFDQVSIVSNAPATGEEVRLPACDDVLFVAREAPQLHVTLYRLKS